MTSTKKPAKAGSVVSKRKKSTYTAYIVNGRDSSSQSVGVYDENYSKNITAAKAVQYYRSDYGPSEIGGVYKVELPLLGDKLEKVVAQELVLKDK